MTNFDEQQTSHRILTVTIILSCLLHVIVLTYRVIHSPAPMESIHSPIEITEISPETLQKFQNNILKTEEEIIAESEKADNNEIDPNAKFLGERNQKASRQMKANQVDDFRVKKGTGSKESAKDGSIPPTEQTEGNTSAAEADGILPEQKTGGVKRNWKTLSMKDLSVGGDGGAQAATDDNLEGVDNGDRTILSTREFKFYSYYHRIKELLRQHWKPDVEHQLVRLWGKGKMVTSDEFVTRVLVTLDNHGQLQRISRLGSSGVEEIDEAAVSAFQKAAPFPNPPTGMIDQDGYVRIRWDFILKADSGPAIQFRTAGGGARY